MPYTQLHRHLGVSVNEDEARAFVSLLQGFAQDILIEDMEETLRTTGPMGLWPMPNTCHPAFSHASDFVLNFDKDRVRISGAIPQRTLFDAGATYPTSSDFRRTVILSRTRCWGMAPFVGDPRLKDARYIWSAWFDDFGRHIVGDSKLVWRGDG